MSQSLNVAYDSSRQGVARAYRQAARRSKRPKKAIEVTSPINPTRPPKAPYMSVEFVMIPIPTRVFKFLRRLQRTHCIESGGWLDFARWTTTAEPLHADVSAVSSQQMIPTASGVASMTGTLPIGWLLLVQSRSLEHSSRYSLLRLHL